jgi:hypothetical protein
MSVHHAFRWSKRFSRLVAGPSTCGIDRIVGPRQESQATGRRSADCSDGVVHDLMVNGVCRPSGSNVVRVSPLQWGGTLLWKHVEYETVYIYMRARAEGSLCLNGWIERCDASIGGSGQSDLKPGAECLPMDATEPVCASGPEGEAS